MTAATATASTSATTSTAARRSAARRRPSAAKVAGFTYVGAWVVGLTAFGVGPAADATDAEIATYFADHRLMTTIQSLLVHGVAAGALLVVLLAVRRHVADARLAHAAGLTAVGLSLLQCALDVARSGFSHGQATVQLLHLVDRLDGGKMFAFAVMIAAALRTYRAAGLVGRRMAIAGAVASVALVLSGIGYGFAVDALAPVAAVSLLLLLVWVAWTGVAVARTER
jgi:hypothetical protein